MVFSMKGFLDMIRSRRSIRRYGKGKIDRTDLEDIVDCGRLAATARNEQPWTFVVVTGKDRLKRIADATSHGKFIKDGSACILVCARDCDYYLEDCCAASQNLLLAAHAKGLGACWVAGHGKDYAKDIKKLAGIPDEIHLVSLIPIGIKEGDAPGTRKLGLEDVISWESY